jgi:hypothetical protein
VAGQGLFAVQPEAFFGAVFYIHEPPASVRQPNPNLLPAGARLDLERMGGFQCFVETGLTRAGEFVKSDHFPPGKGKVQRLPEDIVPGFQVQPNDVVTGICGVISRLVGMRYEAF